MPSLSPGPYRCWDNAHWVGVWERHLRYESRKAPVADLSLKTVSLGLGGARSPAPPDTAPHFLFAGLHNQPGGQLAGLLGAGTHQIPADTAGPTSPEGTVPIRGHEGGFEEGSEWDWRWGSSHHRATCRDHMSVLRPAPGDAEGSLTALLKARCGHLRLPLTPAQGAIPTLSPAP